MLSFDIAAFLAYNEPATLNLSNVSLYLYVVTHTGRYYILDHSRCPYGYEIKTASECSAAAKYLKLYDTSATVVRDGKTSDINFDPPLCFYEGYLKFNADVINSAGDCSSSATCLCKKYSSSTGEVNRPGCSTRVLRPKRC